MNAPPPSPPLSRWFHDLGADVQFAARSLRRTPAFSLVVIVSLGFGLTLAAATLAISHAYLTRALPYPSAQRIYHVMYAPPGPGEPRGMTALDWASLGDVIDAAITSSGVTYFVGDLSAANLARGLRVTPGFLSGLEIRPELGHSFTEGDFKSGGPPVALLTHESWRDRFNSDPNIVGREIRVTPEGQDTGPELLRVVGVLTPGFWTGRIGGPRMDLLLPQRTPVRTYMARLRAGVPVAFAERRLTEAARVVGSEFPPNWTGVHLESVHERYVAGLRPLLLRVNAAAALVLVLVCTNVAILVLLRALRRQKEVAVRVALGAECRHILRLLAAEAGLLCGAAFTLALALTAAALRALGPVIETQLGKPPPAGAATIGIDWPVALVLGGVGLGIALSLALVPLLAPWQRRLADTLRRAGPGATDGPAMRRLRSTLIAFEIAGALVLLVGGGLMVRSVLNLMRTDLGIDHQHVVRARLVLPARSYRDAPALLQFYTNLADRFANANSLAAINGSFPPFYENHQQPLRADVSPDTQISVGALAVGAGYFEVHGIPLRHGREFTLADRLGAEPVAIVSETLARQLWPEGNVLGRRIRAGEPPLPNSPLGEWRTVVGVARDVRQTYVDTDTRDIYLPFFQVPQRFSAVAVRTDRAGSVTLSRLAQLVAEIDPLVQVNDPQPLAADDAQFARARFLGTLLSGFAGFGTLLALLGIYGVTAYAVQQRQREVAIRVAIGASHGHVVLMFLREGGLVLAIGVGLGLAATLAAARIFENQIYGVKPFDLATLAAASAIMAASGLLATWWPVRHAASSDLLVVLKEE